MKTKKEIKKTSSDDCCDCSDCEESRALETFNLVAQLPYTDLYKAQKWLLKKRGEITIKKK